MVNFDDMLSEFRGYFQRMDSVQVWRFADFVMYHNVWRFAEVWRFLPYGYLHILSAIIIFAFFLPKPNELLGSIHFSTHFFNSLNKVIRRALEQNERDRWTVGRVLEHAADPPLLKHTLELLLDMRGAPAVEILVERFDIEPFSDSSAK